jgi:tetratricopeptide (TPR) repeat protein
MVYLPVLHNGFVWDDEFYIQKNSLIQSINLKEIFSRNVMGNYHPLTVLTLAVEYHFFGLNETGYHAVNLLLHLLNVVLVFYIVFFLSEKAEVALIASLLFGIHPLHVESVAWASEIKDLLYTFFFLTAYIFYLRYLKNRQIKNYVFSLLLFLLSILSKAMAASLPVLLLLTDYFKGRKINMKVILEKAPFFLAAVFLGFVAVSAQNLDTAVDTVVYPLPERIIFACYGFIAYLFHLLAPLNLSAYYPYPVKLGEDIPVQYYLFPLLLLALAAAVFYSLKFSRKILFCIGFFVVTVFFVLQLLPIGGAMMADRYSYVPSIGIFYLAAEGFYLLWNKKLIWTVIILLSISTVFFSFKTYTQCGVWKNALTLWNHVIKQYKTIALAYYDRGIYYMDEKRNDEALKDFNKAIELDSNYTEAYINRGSLFVNMNVNEMALNDFSKVVELKPRYFLGYYNRGIVFMNQNKNEDALHDFNKAIELSPDHVYPEAYVNRGNLFRDKNKFNEALQDYNKAIEMRLDFPVAYFNRGTLFMNQKIYDEAIHNYSKAIELNADYSKAYYQRGLSEYFEGKKDIACTDLQHARKLGFEPPTDALNEICN